MECVKCHKTVENVTADGLCFDCQFEAQMADVESERTTITVEQLLAELAGAKDPEAVAEAFGKCEPPTDPMEQETLREKLVHALEGKVKRPGAFADAWLKRAPSADEVARIAKDATRLVQLALEHSVLFHDRDQEPYALIQAGGHTETHRVGSRYFKRWLSKLYYEDANAKPEPKTDEDASPLAGLFAAAIRGSHSSVPNSQALRDALLQLEGLALFEGEEHEVHVRVAALGEHIYLDLADEDWRAVEITRAGWKVIGQSPVRFIRPEGMLPLPEPIAGGSLTDLRKLIHVDDEDWPLIAAFIVGMLRPRGPYPVLELLGEQGSAKSSAGRFIRRIVDPYSPLDRGQPRSEHDLVIAAARSWVLAFDNLSGLPDWLSDALCRISTGGGFGARALYTDDEEKRFDAMRPQLVNGIQELASRGDLLDRAIIVMCLTFKDGDVRSEEDLEAEFLKVWPGVLGAALVAVSTALGRAADVKIAQLPRMADFTRWVVAAEPALGIEDGAFLEAYRRNRAEANAIALEASHVAVEARRFMESRTEWEGTATDLLKELGKLVDEDVRRMKDWPKTGRGLSGAIRRLAPALRRSGISVEFDRSPDASRTRTVTLRRAHAEANTEKANDRPDRPDRPKDADPDDSDGSDGSSPIPSPPQRVRAEGNPSSNGDLGRELLDVGDVVRRIGGVKSIQFRVKTIDGDTADVYELEHGQAGKLRTFKVADLILVAKRGE